MDPKDELLAKLRAIDADANAPEAAPELKPVSPPAPTPSVEAPAQISTDDFLAKLDALDQATRPTPPPVPIVAPTPVAPTPVASPPQQPIQNPSSTSKSAPSRPVAPHSSSGNSPSAAKPSARGNHQSSTSPPSSSRGTSRPASSPTQPYVSLPNVLQRLKQFTQEQLTAHAAQTQAKAKRAQEIARAQAWLDELDPLSDDGFWFEQFAESYESRIQAALDFLDPDKAQSKPQGNSQ